MDPWQRSLRPALAVTLLIGTGIGAPALLAMNYAIYSDRAGLLVRTKGLQLAVFLVLSLLLIPRWGPLGAAIAIVASDLLIQSGLLAVTIIRQTLQHPFRHMLFLAAIMAGVTLVGWALGMAIRAGHTVDRADALCGRMRASGSRSRLSPPVRLRPAFREWLLRQSRGKG